MKNAPIAAKKSPSHNLKFASKALRRVACLGLGVSLIAGLSACRTHVPKEQLYPSTNQRKANAVGHWQQMATQLCDMLSTNRAPLTGKTVYLQCVGVADTDFVRAYHKLLTVELLQRACTVVEQPELAQVVVSVNPQLVQHGKRDIWCNPGTIFGAIGYAFVEFFAGSPYNQCLVTDPSTSQDLLITTFVRGGGQLLAGAVQIVYVPAGDYELYSGRNSEATPPGTWPEVEARARQAMHD